MRYPSDLRIYQAGMDSGNASFESTAPSWDAFDASNLPDHDVTNSSGV